MQGSLAIHDGVLWVGRHAMTAHVRPFDLDGRPLSRGFSFRDPATGRAAVSGLAVDPDHRIWTADRPASRVRAFTLFGREVGGIGGEFPVPATSDAALPLVDPVDVDVVLPVESDGARGDALLVVGSGGARRHAVRVFEPEGGLVASLRPLGDPQEKFLGVEGVAAGGRLVWVCEGLGRRVQVFRDLDFHFAFRLEERGTELRPVAAAPLDDGRVVVTCAGDASRLLLVDGAGRVERVLAEHGAPEGRVFEPSDVAVLEDSSERRTRVFVLDQDGDRVQVFNLEGRCYGAFESEAS